MYKSKLQTYIEILCVLASDGPMKLVTLSTKVDLSRRHLKDKLEFLKCKDLIKKQKLGINKPLYTITKRGLKVLKVIHPIIKEAIRIQSHNFEETATTLSGVEY